MKWLATITTALAASVVLAERTVYQCEDGSRTVHSDLPCAVAPKPSQSLDTPSPDEMRKEIETLYQEMKNRDAALIEEKKIQEERKAKKLDTERLLKAYRMDLCGTDTIVPVAIGMTTQQVKTCAQMQPISTHSTETLYGVSEVWDMDRSGARYIHFRNGRVTAISR